MRLPAKIPLLAAAALLALAGCGPVGPSTPMAALQQEFGGTEISRVYPFRAELGHGSYLYFLQLKGPAAAPTAAIVLKQSGHWSVWEFSTIEVLTGCKEPAAVAVTPVGTVRPPARAPTVIAGRIQGSAQVGGLLYTIGRHSYPATLLPDGFWYTVTNGQGGRLTIHLSDQRGAPIPFCSA